jgi:hypothetical protein
MGKLLLILAVGIAILVIMPIAAIWSLNTLFPMLAIPTTLDTWMASVILSGVVSGQGLTASFKK